MKTRYLVFQRNNGIFFLEDKLLKSQNSLKTRDEETARRICHAKNEALRQPAINLLLARAYLMASDPDCVNRTWQNVMDAVAQTKRGNTLLRWHSAMREAPFDLIRSLKLIETHSEQFLDVLSKGTVSTNIFLRRLHNFALGMDWLPKTIIPQRRWPKIEFREKRGITREEHEKIMTGEHNPEWRAYYSLLWHLGGSQSDIAILRAEDVDWEMQVVSFRRMKTGSVVQIHFGPEISGVLNDLPGERFLFPRIAAMKETDRAKAFMRRCALVGVSGVSLHCYRYAWAERAREAGYPERFAQEALGHKSIAVHRAYAKQAKVKLPSLEEYERKIAPLPAAVNQ
jgi:integrase